MESERKLTIGEHLGELRLRVILSLLAIAAAFIAALAFIKPLTEFWTRPVREALKEGRLHPQKAAETLLTDMHLCLLTAILVSAPIILYQMWRFIASGLYPRERKYVHIFLPISLGLFALGCWFWYANIQPIAFRFLFNMRGRNWLDPLPEYGDCATFSIKMMLMMGMAFQLPLVMMYLEKTGIISPKIFARYRRHAIVGTFVFAMVVTPPDVISQIALAIPTIGLYELGILLGRLSFFERREADTGSS